MISAQLIEYMMLDQDLDRGLEQASYNGPL